MVSLSSQIDTSDALDRLESRYQKRGGALSINFRTAVPWIPYNSHRYTHLLHSYPAKIIPHIPNFFLSARSLAGPGGSILDPFCGSGDIGDIIDVFVRINSTGKALTPQEKRHAKYYNSTFLREADRLARRFQWYLLDMEILSPGQIARMKHIELACELMLSVHQGDVINRKAALDRVMATNSFTDAQTRKAAAKVTVALNRVRKMFPKLYVTRLRQPTDFYSLVVLISKFEAEGLILTDRRRNRLAWNLLEAFAIKVDRVRENQRKAIGIKPDEEIYRDYLLTVSQASDDVNQRRKRETHLRAIIGSLFARKDAQRGFTLEQRRIIWNSAAQRKCNRCGKILSWQDFTIDHIDPHSKGGRSRLENAALMCRSCNSSKGKGVQ